MNSSLNTLERPSSLVQATPVLTEHGFTCTVITLEPGAESALPAGAAPDHQLLFVISGDIAVEAGGLTTLVGHGAATLLAPGDTPTIAARSDTPARVLRVEIPPRRVVTPQIITPRS